MPSTDLSLQDILSRASEHLDSLAEEVLAVEHALGEELGQMPQKPGNIGRLQRLDYLRQSLEDAAMLMHILSKEGQSGVADDVQGKLRLETTRALLRSGVSTAPAAAAGQVDFF